MTGSLDNSQTSRHGNPAHSPPVHLFTNPVVPGFAEALQEPLRAWSRSGPPGPRGPRWDVAGRGGRGGRGGTRGPREQRRLTPRAEGASCGVPWAAPASGSVPPPGSCSVNSCRSSFDHRDDTAIIPHPKISTFNILVKFFVMCFQAHLRFQETNSPFQTSFDCTFISELCHEHFPMP